MRIQIRAHFALLIALLFMPLLIQAKDSKPSVDLKTEIKEYIFHHLEDAYDFSLFSYTKDNGDHKYIGMPLPVILWDDGLQIFSSSKLQHGEGITVAATSLPRRSCPLPSILTSLTSPAPSYLQLGPARYQLLAVKAFCKLLCCLTKLSFCAFMNSHRPARPLPNHEIQLNSGCQ